MENLFILTGIFNYLQRNSVFLFSVKRHCYCTLRELVGLQTIVSFLSFLTVFLFLLSRPGSTIVTSEARFAVHADTPFDLQQAFYSMQNINYWLKKHFDTLNVTMESKSSVIHFSMNGIAEMSDILCLL